MIKVIYDNENVFRGKKYIVTEEETNIFTKKEKDVIKRISKAITLNPSAMSSLLKKYGVEANTEEEIIVALSAAISEDNEQFNYDLAKILAEPRFSRFFHKELEAGEKAGLFAGIFKVLGEGFGFFKSIVGRKGQKDAIEAELRNTTILVQEAERRRKSQTAMIIVGFSMLIILMIAMSIFRPFKRSE